MREIKRYSNRKLYDTVAKKYITLEVIENMIKEGQQLKIVDNDSKEDLTASTLSQIIAERAKKQKIYSPSLFVQMIRKGKGSMYDYLRRIVQSIGETAYIIEEEFEKKIKQLVSSGEITPEEGEALANDIKEHQKTQSMENHLAPLITAIFSKLNIPKKSDVEHLKVSIKKLEQLVKKLEDEQSEKAKTESNQTLHKENQC